MYDIILCLFILLPAKTLCGWAVAAFFVLSSLGTSAIKLVSQSLWNDSAKNGYVKFSNGLLMQWGYSSSSGIKKSITLPLSFKNMNYKVVPVMRRTEQSTTNLTCDIYSKSVSSFVMYGLYHATDVNNGASISGFDWIAIGEGILN